MVLWPQPSGASTAHHSYPGDAPNTQVATMTADRVHEFLQRLTPLTRSNLLTELERLESCDGDLRGAADFLATLRAEFRKDGSAQHRINNPSQYFFAPLQPLLVEGAPEHENIGRIQRGSLAPIWEWISRDLLPTMARLYQNHRSAHFGRQPAQGPAGRQRGSD